MTIINLSMSDCSKLRFWTSRGTAKLPLLSKTVWSITSTTG